MVSLISNHTLGNDYALCTGCTACATICTANAITMQPDGEGFLHPRIDPESCIDCDLCRKICPVYSSKSGQFVRWGANRIDSVYAAWNLDKDIRYKSSSGGVFSALAENILERGGVVVGAAFDDIFVVRHSIIESKEDLHKLRGSKYVQSEISKNIYSITQDLLKQGRIVLFSGTPCQVAGFLNYLREEYDNLFCCDIICHGVPSPKLLEKYIHDVIKKDGLSDIIFRDKTKGWKRFALRWELQGGKSRSFGILTADPYLSAFLRDIALRPSCYNCGFTNIIRTGDVTLADFWGVAKKYPKYDRDDKGTSLVIINNLKGQDWLDRCRSTLFLGKADIETAIAGNSMLTRSASRPVERDAFYEDLVDLPFRVVARKYNLGLPPFHKRVMRSVRKRIRQAVHILKKSEKERG